METLIDLLRRFNRKERYHLIGHALGNPEFRLSEDYKKTLQEHLGVEIPADNVFVAMDYHLDWLIACLTLIEKRPDERNNKFKNTNDLNLNQEDIDLLVVFAQGNTTHLVLIEAKAQMSWTNEQLNSKAKKFKKVFSLDKNVKPYFILTSPTRPSKIKTHGWPEWMLKDGLIPWMELKLPDNLMKITRCDVKGKENKLGTYWKYDKT